MMSLMLLSAQQVREFFGIHIKWDKECYKKRVEKIKFRDKGNKERN